MGKRILINGLIIVAAVGTGVYVTLGPWRMVGKQDAQTQVHVTDMKRAEAHRMQKLDEVDRAESSIGREEAARKAGYFGNGEADGKH